MKSITISILALIAIAGNALADVSLKNGNFFMAYTDVVYSGGLEMKLERVYNSKTSFKGILGWGWGCEFEVFLKASGDGSVVIHEFGGGAENWFSPPEIKPEVMRDTIDRLVRLKYPQANSETESYRTKLNDDQVFRGEEWDNAVKNGILAPRRIPTGTIFTSQKFGHQYLVKSRNGYTRYFDSGKKEEFNDIGQLVQTSDRNDNFIRYEYDDDSRLVKFTDNYDQTLTLSYNGQGLLTGVADIRGRTAEYRYNPLFQMVYSKDVDGNEFRFEYDTRYNMTAIRYSDGTSKEMNYYSKFYYDCIKRVKDRDNTVTSYTFNFDDKMHSKMKFVIVGSDGKKLEESSYEYFSAINAAGGEYTSRLIASLDGDVTDTEYNEFGLPVNIVDNGEETRFRYDQMGHMTYKETPYEIIELEYQPVINKITMVKQYDEQRINFKESRFSYDNKGNLVKASNNEGESVELTYDQIGRIHTLKSPETEISFEYNRNSKPVRISCAGIGDITVTYNDNGEIEKVDSPQGRKVAEQVTSSFQDLLDLIRPAGVNLSF